MKSYNSIVRAVRSMPWAVQPEKLEAMLEFLQLKVEGRLPDASVLADIQAAAGAMAARSRQTAAASTGAVAILPLYGLIMHRGSMVNNMSGPSGTSVEQFRQSFRQAVDDPGVSAIVIDVDSPGGSVEGVTELAAEIFAARGKKKITAVSNCLMASAAYFIASSADEIWASPSSLTGSIGVYLAHTDESKALENEGVVVTLISAGKYKTEGNSYQPLADDGRAAMQSMVDEFYGAFVGAVARGRGVSKSDVKNGFGEGRVLPAAQALKAGMVDKIGSLDDVLAKHGVSRSGSSRAMRSSSPIAAGPLGTVTPKADAVPCVCLCGPCVDGDCSGCTDDDCDCAGCTCDAASASALALAQASIDRAAISRKIAIAAA